jgi:hypothetical protein
VIAMLLLICTLLIFHSSARKWHAWESKSLLRWCNLAMYSTRRRIALMFDSIGSCTNPSPQKVDRHSTQHVTVTARVKVPDVEAIGC